MELPSFVTESNLGVVKVPSVVEISSNIFDTAELEQGKSENDSISLPFHEFIFFWKL